MLELKILPSIPNVDNKVGMSVEATPAVRVADTLLKEAQNRGGHIILEGPPTFLWGQDYQDPAFVGAWHLVNVFLRRFPLDQTSLFFLLDDMTNRPESVTDKLLAERKLQLKNSSLPLASSPIFRTQNYEGLTLVGFRQGQFQNGGQECFVVDAGFQMEKLNHIKTKGGDYDKMRNTSIIIIHPKERFEKEQLQVLNFLNSNKLRNQGYSAQERYRMVHQSYRYIWVNNAGEISGITRPEWDGHKFIGFKQFSIR